MDSRCDGSVEERASREEGHVADESGLPRAPQHAHSADHPRAQLGRENQIRDSNHG